MGDSLKYKRPVYAERNPFNDESEIRCQTFKVLRVKASHECMHPEQERDTPRHTIEPGQFAVCERAIVEGEWTSSYACIPCMDAMIEAEHQCEACTGSDDGAHAEPWFTGAACGLCGAPAVDTP